MLLNFILFNNTSLIINKFVFIGNLGNKSMCLETLDLQIQNITNITELKEKLKYIVEAGKDYHIDISLSLKSLLNNSNLEVICATVYTIAELSKCETKRLTFANEDIIKPILDTLQKQAPPTDIELVKQCCRALGNLCCDCDESRNVLLQLKGVTTLKLLLQSTIENPGENFDEINLLICKIILNFIIGGPEMSRVVVDNGIIDLLQSILKLEVGKVDMNDDMVHTALLVLSVINENTPEFLFSPEVNCLILNVLKETSNVEISEVCLDHLHMQVEHGETFNILYLK